MSAMKVIITDEEALRALSWKAVKAHLESSGWHRDRAVADKGVIYQHTDKDGRLREIAVLTRDDLADYAGRMADAVGTLSRAEDRSELDVYEDLRALGDKLEPAEATDATPSSPGIDEAVLAMHKQIRQWLVGEGWAFEEVTNSSFLLNLAVTFGGGQTVHIVQRHDRVHLAVIRDITLGEDLKSILIKLPENTKMSIQSDLFRDLCLIGVEFEGVDLELDTIRCFARAYFNGLSQDLLMQKMLLVHRATSLVLSTLHRGLQEHGVPSQAASTLLQLVPPDGSHLTLVS